MCLCSAALLHYAALLYYVVALHYVGSYATLRCAAILRCASELHFRAGAAWHGLRSQGRAPPALVARAKRGPQPRAEVRLRHAATVPPSAAERLSARLSARRTASRQRHKRGAPDRAPLSVSVSEHMIKKIRY